MFRSCPAYDYGSVNEAGEETEFNWGYDAVNYNVPEGSYSTDPARGERADPRDEGDDPGSPRERLPVIMDVDLIRTDPERRSLVEYYKGLIALRKQLPGLSDQVRTGRRADLWGEKSAGTGELPVRQQGKRRRGQQQVEDPDGHLQQQGIGGGDRNSRRGMGGAL